MLSFVSLLCTIHDVSDCTSSADTVIHAPDAEDLPDVDRRLKRRRGVGTAVRMQANDNGYERARDIPQRAASARVHRYTQMLY